MFEEKRSKNWQVLLTSCSQQMRQLEHSREDDMRVETKKGVVFEAGM
jgi:hypothetical protein